MDTRLLITTGAESSGKTTLAQDLAAGLGAPLVPELSRLYLEARRAAAADFVYAAADLLAIARLQHARERDGVAEGPPLLICDTDLLVIEVWSEVKYGECHPWIRRTLREAAESGTRHYLLCDWRIPWQADPLRENPHDRDVLHERYLAKLRDYGFDYTLVQGDPEQRLATALRLA